MPVIAPRYTARMTEHTEHTTDTSDLDAWVSASNTLGAGYRNARTFPADGPLVHMTGAEGDIVLRQWAPETTTTRIEWLADALNVASEATGNLVPTFDAVPGTPDARSILIDGRRYTRASFLPGRPLGRYGGSRTPDGETINIPLHESAGAQERITEATRIIARIHTATRNVAGREDAPVATLGQMMQSVRDIWAEQRRLLGDIAADNRDIRRWLRCGNRIIPTSSDLLRNETAILHERTVLVHGNFWPDDILVDRKGQEITGIVGWSTGAAGSPVLDLAGLAVHMQGWSAPLTEAIVQTYAGIAPLLPEQRRMVPVVASLDLVARVAWLLHLNYVDDRMIGHPAMPVIRSGMKTLLNSLETLTHILAPDIDETRRHQRGRAELRGTSRRFAPGVGRGRPSGPRKPPGRRKQG